MCPYWMNLLLKRGETGGFPYIERVLPVVLFYAAPKVKPLRRDFKLLFSECGEDVKVVVP